MTDHERREPHAPMNTPDPTLQRPTADVRQSLPSLTVDHLVELVVARIRDQRAIFYRWLAGTFTIGFSLGGAVGGGISYYLDQIERDIARQSTKARAESRIDYARSDAAFRNATPLEVNESLVHDLQAGERWHLRVEVPEQGLYSVDVESVDPADPADPVVYLYEKRSGDSPFLNGVTFDDDGGTANQDARVRWELTTASVYYLEIEEITGRSGSVRVTLSLV